jgi:hypothetical protein
MDKAGITRTSQHTEMVLAAFGSNVVWNEYGITGGTKVCPVSFLSFLPALLMII